MSFRLCRFPTQKIRLSTRNVRSQSAPEPSEPFHKPTNAGLATPRQLVEFLDQFVVGQAMAKKVLSVAVFNHYNRVRANMFFSGMESRDSLSPAHQGSVQPANFRPLRKDSNHNPLVSQLSSFPLFEKSNVLVIGPTGSGKTLLAKTLAKVLDVPFSISDATSFTQAGYVGEDVDMAIQRLLLAANWDPVRASMGIVYIDEIDKISRKSSSGTEGSRDVAGEGVQQGLLRMMEGTVVPVQSKANEGSSANPPPFDGHSRNNSRVPQTPKPDTYYIDTSNVLFILSGAFVGLDKIIERRVSRATMGFATTSSTTSGPKAEAPQFFTPNNKASQSVLSMVDTSDLVQYGFIPEFISRLPTITTLEPLTISDLRRILTDVKGSLVSQYQSLFGYSDSVDIRFSTGALEEICKLAIQKSVGARGLRGIMENLLLEPMYLVPGSNIRYILIKEDTVRGGPPGYWDGNQEVAFLEAWVAEERTFQQKVNV